MKTIGDPIPVTGRIPPPVCSVGHFSSHPPTAPKILQVGIKVVIGVQPLKPIFGAPDGRQRLRMRNTITAKLFVKTETGIRCFVLEDCGDRWFCNPILEQGRNLRF